MRLTYLCVLVPAAASVLTSAFAAGVNTTGAARRGIQTALTERTQARQRRDLNGFMATFTPDWATVNVTGKVVDFATLRRSMAANFSRTPTTGVISSSITRLTANESTAQVTVSTHFDFPPQKAPSGLVYAYKDTVASEVWVKGPTGWKEKRERYLVDTGGVSARPLTFARRRLPKL